MHKNLVKMITENISKHIWDVNFTMIIVYSEITFSKNLYHVEASQSFCFANQLTVYKLLLKYFFKQNMILL